MLPNTIIASEINPLAGATPDHKVTAPHLALKLQMALWHGISLNGETLTDVVLDLLRQCGHSGWQPIIRDWTHHDFRRSELNRWRPSRQFRIIHELEESVDLKVFAFIRDAIDVYLSSMQNIDEFADDYLSYVQKLHKSGIPIIKYEDMVSNPEETVRAICSLTGVMYSDAYTRFTHNKKCTGDIQMGRLSRGIRQKAVVELPRKRVLHDIRVQIESNSAIREANILMGYPPSYVNGRVETWGQMIERRLRNTLEKKLLLLSRFF